MENLFQHVSITLWRRSSKGQKSCYCLFEYDLFMGSFANSAIGQNTRRTHHHSNLSSSSTTTTLWGKQWVIHSMGLPRGTESWQIWTMRMTLLYWAISIQELMEL